jgi:hypothetical protein
LTISKHIRRAFLTTQTEKQIDPLFKYMFAIQILPICVNTLAESRTLITIAKKANVKIEAIKSKELVSNT